MKLATLRVNGSTRAVRLDGDRLVDLGAADLGELFARDGWAERARALQGALAEVTGSLRAGERDALADGFVLSAAVLRHLAADPLLPDELLGPDWPGASLREHFAGYYAAYQGLLYDWLRSS